MSDLQRHLGSKPYLLADHVELGFNYRMTDIQGILGSMQMNRVKNNSERRSLAKYYIENLNELNWLKLPMVNKTLHIVTKVFLVYFNLKS